MRARSAIVVVAADWLNRFFVVEAWGKKCPTAELIEKVFEVNATWKPTIFGVEANAMQALFADALAIIGEQRNVMLPLSAIMQSTKIDKLFRIRTILQPTISESRLFVQPEQVDLRNELRAFPLGDTVDLVDALASVINLVPPTPQQRRTDDDQGLVDYLQRIGASPDQIKARLAQFHR